MNDGATFPPSSGLEADHRIANHLALLGSYVRLKGAGLTRGRSSLDAMDVAVLVGAIGAQINAVAHLHRILSHEGSQGSVDLGGHLRGICTALRTGVSGDVSVFETFATDCMVPLTHLLPVAQILTELITNAIKHGHRPGASAIIEVSCFRKPDGAIQAEVRDNGPGLLHDINRRISDGIGIRLVQRLVEQIGGTIDYSSTDEGTTVRLTLPRGPAGTDRSSGTD